MSGVLDRMVQRSRGQLPAIEPLLRAQQTAAAALPSAVEESAAAAPRGRNVALEGEKRTLREESARPVQDNVKLDTARAGDAARNDARRSGALEVAPVKRAAESDVTSAAKDADQDGWDRTRLERAVEPQDVAQESEEPHESSVEMRSEMVPTKSEETVDESIRTRVEQQAATRDTSTIRNEAGDAASADNAAEHTEIHITIGSVELRAPRVVPAPSLARAFRPRVTLDEFLKRGTGSGGWGAKS
jgi:hypothetical protein